MSAVLIPAALILFVIFSLWILSAIAYLHGLRRVVEHRERVLQQDLARLADFGAAWRRFLEGLGQREWREAADHVEQELQVLTGSQALVKKLEVVGEIKLLHKEQKEALSRTANVMPSEIRETAAQLDRVLERLGRDVATYNASAADAAFACERFPLSTLALAVGLAKPNIYR